MKKLLFLCIVAVLCSCSSSDTTVKTINAEQVAEKNAEIGTLVDLAERVEEIPLESCGGAMLDNISDIVPYKNLLLILNGGKCSLFNKEGNFISHLGTKGNGPQEYLYIEDAFARNDTIYLYDSSKNRILLFNQQGAYIKSVEFKENMGHSRGTAMLPNGQFAFYLPDKGEHPTWRTLTIFDASGAVVDSIARDSKLSRFSNINWYFKEGSFTEYKDVVNFKYTFNDTIYRLVDIKGKLHAQPAYVFALGSAAAIENAREEVIKTMMQPKMFDPFKTMAKIELLGESSKYLFFKINGERGYFYNKYSGELCKYNPEPYMPFKLDSGGSLWCVKASENGDNNPIIVRAEIK